MNFSCGSTRLNMFVKSHMLTMTNHPVMETFEFGCLTCSGVLLPHHRVLVARAAIELEFMDVAQTTFLEECQVSRKITL
jgi:hypothetical protein